MKLILFISPKMFKRPPLTFIKKYNKIREALKPIYCDTFKNKNNDELMKNCFKDPLIKVLF